MAKMPIAFWDVEASVALARAVSLEKQGDNP